MFDNILKIKDDKEESWIKDNLAEWESHVEFPSTKFAQYNWWTRVLNNVVVIFKEEVKIMRMREDIEINSIIEKDIKYQKSKLTGDFEKDKAINWRLAGWDYFKEQFAKQKDEVKEE